MLMYYCVCAFLLSCSLYFGWIVGITHHMVGVASVRLLLKHDELKETNLT